MDSWQKLRVATCIAYVAAGVLAVVWRSGPAAAVMGGWLILLGLGSAVYHIWEWSIRAHRVDQFTMYGTFTALALHAATGATWTWLAMIVAGLVAGWLLALRPSRELIQSLTVLQPIMLVLGFLVAIVVALEGTWWMSLVALAAVGLAWIAWWREKLGHSIWHVLTATAILVLFLGVR